MKFMLIQRQRGEGCGYMIGCGMKYEIIDLEGVTNLDAAVVAISDILAYPDGMDEEDWEDVCFALEGQFDLAEAWIFPLEDGREIDLDGVRDMHEDWKKDMQRKMDEENDKKNEAHERAEYKRLKKKFNKG